MHSSLRPNQTSPYSLEPSIFSQLIYPFSEPQNDSASLLKTSIEINPQHSTLRISILTKIIHKNIINLKKIGKSKKASSSCKNFYWLYYENVPYTLNDKKHQISVIKLKETIHFILQYLYSQRIYLFLRKENIGISKQNEIKVYLPAEDILASKQQCSHSQIIAQVEDIVNWFEKTVLNQSIPSRGEEEIKKISNKKLDNIDEKLENIRRKIKSVENKYHFQSTSANPLLEKEVNKNKINEFKKIEENIPSDQNIQQDKIQQNINCINIFHNTNQIMNPKKPPLYYQDFDNDSVDTYQMEMGEDYEMPSIKTNQRLRQTIYTDKNQWDTMTARSPQKKKKNIHESAGNKVFNRIIEENKAKLENQKNKISDSQTVHETLKDRGVSHWPSSTFRSDASPNIQQRVQQALKKTKNVMHMLKNNTKSFSAQKL